MKPPKPEYVAFEKPIPPTLRVWGLTLDDIWTLEQVAEDSDDDGEISKVWTGAIDGVWPKTGIDVNARKNVDGDIALGAGANGIQGAFVHTYRHWLGAPSARRAMRMGVTLTHQAHSGALCWVIFIWLSIQDAHSIDLPVGLRRYTPL